MEPGTQHGAWGGMREREKDSGRQKESDIGLEVDSLTVL